MANRDRFRKDLEKLSGALSEAAENDMIRGCEGPGTWLHNAGVVAGVLAKHLDTGPIVSKPEVEALRDAAKLLQEFGAYLA